MTLKRNITQVKAANRKAVEGINIHGITKELASGLHIPVDKDELSKRQRRTEPKFPKLGKKAPQGKIAKVAARVKRAELMGFEEIHYASVEQRHTLDEAARKERRADNKAMRKIHSKTRGRKKHGR